MSGDGRELAPVPRRGYDRDGGGYRGREADRSVPVPLNHPNHRDGTWLNRRLGASLLLSQADVELLNALRPRCAKCGKPVESFSWTRSASDLAIAFSVGCHGEVEETRVRFDDLPAVMLGGVQGGEAFGAPRLLKENSEP